MRSDARTHMLTHTHDLVFDALNEVLRQQTALASLRRGTRAPASKLGPRIGVKTAKTILA